MAAVVMVVMAATDLRGPSKTLRLIARVAAIFALLTTAAFAFSTPERDGWVTDEAGILDADTAGAIASKLTALQRNTGAEVVVVTLSSLQGVSIETWGNALRDSWRVGRSGGNDTGVLLIVAPNDRKVRIAVGYGLGNRISDSIAAAIISDHILPYFRQGNFPRGVKAGVDSIALQLDRPTATNTTNVERAYPVSFKQPSLWTRIRTALTPSHHTKVIAFWVAVAIVVLIWMVLNAGNLGGRRRSNGWYDYSDNDGGWFSSSGNSCGSSWGGSSSSSGSSGGGSSSGGATGSW